MFLQALFRQQKKQVEEICPAEQLLEIVRELLNKEFPEHRLHHHILYTANTSLENLRNHLEYHRSQCNATRQLGKYHTHMVDHLRKKLSDLQCLVDGYMELNVDVKLMNHRLHFHHERIMNLYENYKHFPIEPLIEDSSKIFWQAVKDDVLDILRKVL